MPTTIATGREQVTLTVNQLLSDPLLVPELMRTFFRDQFIADQILRPAGRATGGAVQYWEAGPVLPDTVGGGVEVVAPMAEIPVVNPIVGAPKAAQVLKRGLGLRISRELADRNNVGIVMSCLQQIRNAMVASVDGALMTAINAATTQTVAVATPWDAATGTTIRRDLTAARAIPEGLRDTGFDYQPDTLLINRRTRDDLMLSSEFQAPFIGQVAGQNPLLAGQLPDSVWGYRFLVSPQVPFDVAYLLQRQVVGGIADERGTPGEPIEVSDPFPEPAHEATRWNVTRAVAGFIDNPNAIIRLQNVET